MTRQQALRQAIAIFGKRAAVQIIKNGGNIGAHGEFVRPGFTRKGDNPRNGRYRCATCTTETVEGGDFIVREVWHALGGHCASYRVGYIDNIIGAFNIQAEAGSFEDALAEAKGRKAGV